MTYMEKQKAEMETIKPRAFFVDLSDADVKRFYEKAASCGFMPSEILEHFIGDLVFGTCSNSSDERMYADQWFDRAKVGYSTKKKFLSFVLNNGHYDSVISYIDDIDEGKEGVRHPLMMKNMMRTESISDFLLRKAEKSCWISLTNTAAEILTPKRLMKRS